MDGRFIADQMIEHPNREDCYIARLLVRKVSPEDSKKYFLAVENIHGEDRYAVALNVKGMQKVNHIELYNALIIFYFIIITSIFQIITKSLTK